MTAMLLLSGLVLGLVIGLLLGAWWLARRDPAPDDPDRTRW